MKCKECSVKYVAYKINQVANRYICITRLRLDVNETKPDPANTRNGHCQDLSAAFNETLRFQWTLLTYPIVLNNN